MSSRTMRSSAPAVVSTLSYGSPEKPAGIPAVLVSSCRRVMRAKRGSAGASVRHRRGPGRARRAEHRDVVRDRGVERHPAAIRQLHDREGGEGLAGGADDHGGRVGHRALALEVGEAVSPAVQEGITAHDRECQPGDPAVTHTLGDERVELGVRGGGDGGGAGATRRSGCKQGNDGPDVNGWVHGRGWSESVTARGPRDRRQ